MVCDEAGGGGNEMKMGQEWEAWTEAIPRGARIHLRFKAAAHYKEGVRKAGFVVRTKQTGLSTRLLAEPTAPAAQEHLICIASLAGMLFCLCFLP